MVYWMTTIEVSASLMLLLTAAKSLQSCLTLCDPIEGSPSLDSPWILEWVAISFSGAWKWKVKVKSLSHVWLLATPWTAAYQAPPSMGFSKQECWSGLPLPSPTIAFCFPNTRSQNTTRHMMKPKYILENSLCAWLYAKHFYEQREREKAHLPLRSLWFKKGVQYMSTSWTAYKLLKGETVTFMVYI